VRGGIFNSQIRKGRIHPHQRTTDDVGAILGTEFEFPDNYKDGNDSDKQLITSTPSINSGQQQKRMRTPATNVLHLRRQLRRLDNSNNHDNDTTAATTTTATVNNNNNINRHTTTATTRNDTTITTNSSSISAINTDNNNNNDDDDDIPFTPDEDEDYDRNNTVLNNTQLMIQNWDQEEVDAWYDFERKNIHEQGRLIS